jgi:hypothetical protein
VESPSSSSGSSSSSVICASWSRGGRSAKSCDGLLPAPRGASRAAHRIARSCQLGVISIVA